MKKSLRFFGYGIIFCGLISMALIIIYSYYVHVIKGMFSIIFGIDTIILFTLYFLNCKKDKAFSLHVLLLAFFLLFVLAVSLCMN